MDYTPIFDIQRIDPSLPEEGVIRRTCFNVSLTDNNVYENTESFNVILELDTFTIQSGVRVDPPVTEIFILDNDGKFFVMVLTLISVITFSHPP